MAFLLAPRHKLETREQSLARIEHLIACKLDLQEGMTCLDIGCGIGGPLREIARFSGAKVTGLNISEFQVSRAKYYNHKYDLDHLCDVVVGDFHHIPFDDNTFDAVYCTEATCHSPHREKVFAEVFRVLKPGGKFLSTEWCLTDKYDPKNPEHVKVKTDIEYSNALSPTTTCAESKQKVEEVGFKVLHDKDYGVPDRLNPVPWYNEFARSLSLSGLAASWLGIWILYILMFLLELVYLVPRGTTRSQGLLQMAANSLLKGGDLGIYTVCYMIVAEKPKKNKK